ncbi:ribosome maturation factor RimP [Gordonia aichiensis]|uniref:Ribosome maturation factor RimP n=1 Tax=Gordonia aichiensis NBRC 108223 TaxID=1220583 RepID=L7KMN2_9ACTN|nr:ribosome maturation factor RimP [Gordonia aichiensis]GAC49874.1 ribosome maturation factor RimP [Gordonia aichiensis NBRC 108223]
MTIDVQQLRALVDAFVAERGFDVEDVTIGAGAGGDAVVVIVDRDGGGSLDEIADLSRELSDALDADPAYADIDTLEVTSPGVDRPLTTEQQWRRAAGRKVLIDLLDGDEPTRVVGRVGPLHDGQVDVVSNDRGRFRVRAVELDSVTRAVVDVDFSRPGAAELRLCGLDDEQIAQRRDSVTS